MAEDIVVEQHVFSRDTPAMVEEILAKSVKENDCSLYCSNGLRISINKVRLCCVTVTSFFFNP